MNKLSLVVIEDEALIREGICSIINSRNDNWIIVGTADNGQEGLELISNLKPDVVLTDIKMPYIDGLELTGIIRERDEETIIIILTGHADFSYAQQALKYNVMDFILKPSSANEILNVIHKAQLLKEKQEQSKKAIAINSTNVDIMTNLMLNLIYNQAFVDDVVQGNRDKVKAKVMQQIERTGFWSLNTDVAYEVLIKTFQGILNRMLNDKMITQEDYRSINNTDIKGGNADLSAQGLNLLFARNIDRLITLYANSKNNNKLAIRKAIAFVYDNFSRDVTLKEVADQVYLSYYYFSQLFKKETGMNFTEYLTQVRMEKAKELLKDVRYKTYEVAQMLGYGSAKHFSVIFKKSFGLSPSDYRNKYDIGSDEK